MFAPRKPGDRRPGRFLAYPVDRVVLARVLDDFQPDLLPLARLGDGLVVELHGVDALAKVAGVPEDADRVSDAQGSRLDPDRRDGEMAVIVRHDADEFLPGERLR